MKKRLAPQHFTNQYIFSNDKYRYILKLVLPENLGPVTEIPYICPQAIKLWVQHLLGLKNLRNMGILRVHLEFWTSCDFYQKALKILRYYSKFEMAVTMTVPVICKIIIRFKAHISSEMTACQVVIH